MILFFLFGCCIAVALSALDGDAFLFVWAYQISSLDAQRSLSVGWDKGNLLLFAGKEIIVAAFFLGLDGFGLFRSP